jgi:hypothetical protein
MLGRIAVTGLGAATLFGGTAVAAAPAFDAEREGGERITAADLRKNDDADELVLLAYDDDDTDGDTGTNTGNSAASRASNPDTTGTRDTTDARRGVRVSAGQLLVNQRISQAALKRLAIVEARREGKPDPRFDSTSGDTRDAVARVRVSVAQLKINQRISQAAVRKANRLAGRPTPVRAGSGRVTLSSAQLLINQRISQAAVRRANTLLAAEPRR